MKTLTLIFSLLVVLSHAAFAEEVQVPYDDAKHSGSGQGAGFNPLGGVSNCPCDKNAVGTDATKTPHSDASIKPVGEAAGTPPAGDTGTTSGSGNTR